MVVLASTKVGMDFRVTIPKEVREFLELNEGDEIVFYSIGRQKGRVGFRKISS